MYENSHTAHRWETEDVLSPSGGNKSTYYVSYDSSLKNIGQNSVQAGPANTFYQEPALSNAYAEASFHSQGVISKKEPHFKDSSSSEITGSKTNNESVPIQCDNKVEMEGPQNKSYLPIAEVANETINQRTEGTSHNIKVNKHNKASGGKCEAFDLYSFWNTFDPNETSPEPAPETTQQEIRSEPNSVQYDMNINNISTPHSISKSNVNPAPIRRMSRQDELQMSSAIAASQLSSAVIKKANEFNTGMINPTTVFHPPSNEIGRSHVSLVQNVQYPQEQHSHKPKDSQYIGGPKEWFPSTTSRYSLPSNNLQNFNDKSVQHYPGTQALQQNSSLHPGNVRPSYNGVNTAAPITSELQNLSQQVNRNFPTNPNPPRNDPVHFSYYHPPNDPRTQYMSSNSSQAHPNSVLPHPPVNHNNTQNHMQPLSHSHGVSPQRPIHPANMQSNRLATHYAPNNWANSYTPYMSSGPSITAASNNLINNSIIYKSSLPLMPTRDIHKQQSSGTPATYPPLSYTNPNSSITKPWDYIPKYNTQRHEQNALGTQENYLHRHSNPPAGRNILHEQGISNGFHVTQQAASCYPSSSWNKNAELALHTHGYGTTHTFINNQTPETYHQNHLQAKTNPTTATTSQSMFQAYSEIPGLNNTVHRAKKYFNNEISKSAGEYKDSSVPNFGCASVTSQRNQVDPKIKIETTSSGTLCYNCGAFVGSATVADDETTIAICGNCKEVLYFVSDNSSSKGKKLLPLHTKTKTDTMKKRKAKSSSRTKTIEKSNLNTLNG